MTHSPSHTARRIGIIGYGAAGRSCAALLAAADCEILVLTRTQPDETASNHPAFAVDLDALLAWEPDTIIEAASAEAFAEMVPQCLDRGVDVVPASAGALQSTALASRVREACARGGARLILPSGALGGLDYIAAAALSGDISVTYISRKPPAAWTAELAEMGCTERARTEAVILFEGSAPDAAKLYPKNLNAGLTIALAAGFDRTRVRVVADPTIARNTHEVAISGAAGEAFMRFENRPSADNPKTSAITALSLVSAALQRGQI